MERCLGTQSINAREEVQLSIDDDDEASLSLQMMRMMKVVVVRCPWMTVGLNGRRDPLGDLYQGTQGDGMEQPGARTSTLKIPAITDPPTRNRTGKSPGTFWVRALVRRSHSATTTTSTYYTTNIQRT